MGSNISDSIPKILVGRVKDPITGLYIGETKDTKVFVKRQNLLDEIFNLINAIFKVR